MRGEGRVRPSKLTNRGQKKTGSEQEPQWPGLLAFGMSAKQAQCGRQKEHAEDQQVGEEGRLGMKDEESRMHRQQDGGRHQESARRSRSRPHSNPRYFSETLSMW